MRLYCFRCGKKLELKKLALKNKGMVIDAVVPHECEDGHLENITDNLHKVNQPASECTVKSSIIDDFLFKDKRKDIRTHAPQGIISMIEGLKRGDDNG